MGQRRDSKKIRRAALTLVVALALLGMCSLGVWAYTQSKTQKVAENEFYPAKINIVVIEENVTGGTDESDGTKALSVEWETETSGSDILYTADKSVQIKNVDETDANNADAYIRVAIVPKWTADVVTETADTTSVPTVPETTQAVDVWGPSYGLQDFGSLSSLSSSDLSTDPTQTTTFTMGDVTFTLADDWYNSWVFIDGYFYYKYILSPGETTAQLLDSVTISSKTYNILTNYDITLEVDIISDSIQTEAGAFKERWGFKPESASIETE